MSGFRAADGGRGVDRADSEPRPDRLDDEPERAGLPVGDQQTEDSDAGGIEGGGFNGAATKGGLEIRHRQPHVDPLPALGREPRLILDTIEGLVGAERELVGLAVAPNPPARSYSLSRARIKAKPPLLASETSPLKTKPSAVTVTGLADTPPITRSSTEVHACLWAGSRKSITGRVS